jgi:hypothetical protein
MRILVCALCVLLGCSNSIDPDDRVTELSRTDQETLCQDFLDEVCTNDIGGFCNNACILGACAAAASSGSIDTECTGGITVAMVNECAAAADLAICQQGGGCMIDALEAVCP